MALSQVECLDDNHVNCPLQESTPEFLYSEDQRLALEALIHGGRKAFQEYIQDHSVRQFLSELEQKRLASAGSHPSESEGERAEDGEDAAGSLQYWPERSDDSIPELDIGWPDRVSYRGVTRVSVYTQPPMDGETHIKEIVRKTISNAQKVIGVVMDLFTDVDIFKDLLDASFRRKVAVYIILEATGLPHFLTMCKRASMHCGHLKNLRVRSTGGTVLRTRSHGTVCGLLSQKFMFVDGDRAVSGSYSYTWMASRLDRNLITVLTGEVVETFDKQFRQLYLESEGVNLNKIGLEAEPVPKPAPQRVAVPEPTPAVRRTVVNPKYALVNTKGDKDSSGPQKAGEGLTGRSSCRSCASVSAPAGALQRPGAAAEGDPIHTALRGLEYADMMHYLPTWPEPDAPSDVAEDCSDPVRDHLTSAKQHLETSRPIQSEETLKETAKELLDLRGTNGLSSPPGQRQQRGAEEGTSISTASEEHHENLNTANCLGSPDSPLVQKEAKDISSNSAISTQQDRNHHTSNGPSTTQQQGIEKETKEGSRIFEISEEHHKNLQTTNGSSTTDARVIDTAENGESKICTALNESHQNLKPANGPKTRDAVVEEREEVVLSVPKMSEERDQKHRAPNGPTTIGTPRVQEEDKGVSDTSAKSGHHQNTQTTTLDSACNGLVQSEVQCQADERDAAKASQPIVAQHLQELPHPHNAAMVVPVDTKRQQEWRQTRGQEQKDGWKVIRTLPRALGGDVHFQQEVHTWGAGTRLNGKIHPPNLAGTNAGRQQSFWQGNDLTQRRPGQGSDPQSFQKLPQLRDQSPFPGRTAPTRLGIRASHAPRRQHQGGPRAQQVRGRPATRGPVTHWPSEPQGDRSGTLGPQYTGPSHLRAVNRTALGPRPAAYRGWNS